jgi:hypothetical protein
MVVCCLVGHLLQLTPVGFSYLGGGDNGQGQNAMVRGVAQAPCPPGTTLQLLNADGVSEPGEDPRQLLNNYCVPCEVGTFCDSSDEGEGGPCCSRNAQQQHTPARQRSTYHNSSPREEGQQ